VRVSFGRTAQNSFPSGSARTVQAACLLAFALATLVAAIFLIGQVVARHTSATMADLRVLQAVGLTSRQAIVSAAAPLFLTAAAGASLGVAAAIMGSRWMAIGAASYAEPHPGLDADWLILGPGWALAPALVAAGAAAAAALALTAPRRPDIPRRSGLAAAAAAAGLGVPVVVGARFALEPGRGRSAVPVWPTLIGAVVPSGPHNSYSDGAWLTPTGYDRLFRGAHYAFKFHAATVALRSPLPAARMARRSSCPA